MSQLDGPKLTGGRRSPRGVVAFCVTSDARHYLPEPCRIPLSQSPLSRLVSRSNSPESSHTPPHFSQVSIDTFSNLVSLRFPSHLGQRIEDVPAAFACSVTFIFSCSFSIASL